MPYQPTHPHPYLEPIDASNKLGNVFTTIINPKDIITKYNLIIVPSDSLDVIYTTNDVSLGSPLYGSEKGTILQVPIPVNCGMVNGNNYRWKITLYDAIGNYIDSPFYFFSAKSSPVITFDVPTTISTCEYQFTAHYVQEENEPFMYYKYTLYRDGVLIDETHEKMDALLSYTYNSFLSGSTYRIDLAVMTIDRVVYQLSRIFTVEYNTQDSVIFSKVEPVMDKNCLNVDFSQNIFIKGNVDQDVTYSNFKNVDTQEEFTCVSLGEGSTLFYNRINENNPLSLGDEFTVYYSVHFGELFIGDIITLTDEVSFETYTVRYDGSKFYYKIGAQPEVAIDPYVNDNNIHQETSVIHSAGTTTDDLKIDTLYVLYDDDIIGANNVIMYNDIATNFWWNFVLLPDRVLIYKGQKYSESVVS